MPEELSPQHIDHLVAEAGGYVYLGICEKPAQQRDHNDQARHRDDRGRLAHEKQTIEKRHRSGERLAEQDVVEDHLQGPGPRELGEGQAERAAPGPGQAALRAGELAPDDLGEAAGLLFTRTHRLEDLMMEGEPTPAPRRGSGDPA